jgi:hypothetical protein
VRSNTRRIVRLDVHHSDLYHDATLNVRAMLAYIALSASVAPVPRQRAWHKNRRGAGCALGCSHASDLDGSTARGRITHMVTQMSNGWYLFVRRFTRRLILVIDEKGSKDCLWVNQRTLRRKPTGTRAC